RAMDGWSRTFPVGRSRALLHRANLALVDGQPKRAQAKLDAAEALAKQHDLGWELARIELSRAGLARAWKQSPDAALAKAAEGFAALGMQEQHAVLLDLLHV